MSSLSQALQEAVAARDGWSLRRIQAEMQQRGAAVSFATIGVYLRGEHGRPEERVLEAFCAVFPELTMTRLRTLAALPAGEDEPWTPPVQSARLSRRERAALDELVAAVTAREPRLTAVSDADLVAELLSRPRAVQLVRERLQR